MPSVFGRAAIATYTNSTVQYSGKTENKRSFQASGKVRRGNSGHGVIQDTRDNDTARR